MSELKTTQQSHADNDISLAWDEYEKCGEVGNYSENLLHAAEFYQTEAKTKEQENQRLTAIATKHATRADELYEALEKIMPAVKQYLEYEHDGDPWTEDARSMGEMALNELDSEGVIEEIIATLDKSRIEAEGK